MVPAQQAVGVDVIAPGDAVKGFALAHDVNRPAPARRRLNRLPEHRWKRLRAHACSLEGQQQFEARPDPGLGGDAVRELELGERNPGRYLALLPPGAGVLTQNPGDKFDAWDASTGIQYMPSEHVTWGLEFVHRQASVPYFAGHGGLTSPNGWHPPIGDPTGFVADLVTSENRIIGSIIVRF